MRILDTLGQVEASERWRRLLSDWAHRRGGKVHILVRGAYPPKTLFDVSGDNFLVFVINLTVAYPVVIVDGT